MSTVPVHYLQQFDAFCDEMKKSSYLEEIRCLDKHFRINAGVVVLIWLSFVLLAFAFVPIESRQELSSTERNAALFAFLFLMLSLIGRLFTLQFSKKGKRKPLELSGILIGSITVQCIALCTDAMMACGLFRLPVVLDPVFGNRVHLLRWCEWSPLAYYMTFLTLGIDAPRKDSKGLRTAYQIGASQGLSTLCGLLFPFARGKVEWSILMVVCCVLYFAMFPCLYQSWKRLRIMKVGVSSFQIELHERSRLSYNLLLTCTIGWTLLVIMFFVSGLGILYTSNGSFLKNQAFNMIWESIMDVILKNLYMNVIFQVHKAVFDDRERAERQFKELRRLMNAIWESSSDVICVSVRSNSEGELNNKKSTVVRTMVSPAYLRGYHPIQLPSKLEHETSNKAILFDIHMDLLEKRNTSVHYSNIKAVNVQTIEFNSLSELDSLKMPADIYQNDAHINESMDQNVLSSMAGLIARAWNIKNGKTSLNHRLLKSDGVDQHVFTFCEANICHLEKDSILMVVRDISERSQRFEAEKRMIFETTARRKDEEANRFTRHEVKNGLLAAIGLCESLREKELRHEESISSPKPPAFNNSASVQVLGACAGSSISVESPNDMSSSVISSENYTNMNSSSSSIPARLDISRCTQELDKTLQDVLDTILSEAMARDVIHGVYEPKMERVDINQILCTVRTHHGGGGGGGGVNFGINNDERFPIVTNPTPLPTLYFDPQLLKYIHRNAVSNACKYGKQGGAVTTTVYFDSTREMLYMKVENLPGDNHDNLVELGDKACDAVFSPGTRLHGRDTSDLDSNRTHSAGDGAWIMRKCAETLKGKASIRFETTKTVFSFNCPARQFDQEMLTRGSVDPESFRLPPKTWGIAIDDSKIQRKLLEHFLKYTGVEQSRQIVLGRDKGEILSFVDLVVQLVNRHPHEYFLLIVDENLDIVEDGTSVSGSESIDSIRRRILPEQEQRLLALVRSANDSAHDIALYNSRAHGFVPKAPIRKSTVLDTIAPLWEKRFRFYSPHEETSEDGPMSSIVDDNRNDSLNDFTCMVIKGLREDLDAVDEICSEEAVSLLVEKWPLIWERLHRLKGDLLSWLNNPTIQIVVSDIDSLRGPTMPKDFLSRWASLRSNISSSICVQNISGSSDSELSYDSDIGNRKGRKRKSRQRVPSVQDQDDDTEDTTESLSKKPKRSGQDTGQNHHHHSISSSKSGPGDVRPSLIYQENDFFIEDSSEEKEFRSKTSGKRQRLKKLVG